jgi:hypothetical protein
MAQVHFHFEGLELVGETSAGLCAHLLVGPLLQAVEFLVDVHDCGGVGVEVVGKRGASRMTRGRCGVRNKIWAVCREQLSIRAREGGRRRHRRRRRRRRRTINTQRQRRSSAVIEFRRRWFRNSGRRTAKVESQRVSIYSSRLSRRDPDPLFQIPQTVWVPSNGDQRRPKTRPSQS